MFGCNPLGSSYDSLCDMARALQKFTSLVTLDLSYSTFCLRHNSNELIGFCNLLAETLGSLPLLQDLDLSYNVKFGGHLHCLLSKVRVPLNILRLIAIDPHESDIIYMTSSKFCHSMRMIDISGNYLKGQGVLLSGLMCCMSQTISVVNMKKCYLTSDDIVTVFQKLPNMPQIKIINLENNDRILCQTYFDIAKYVICAPMLNVIKVSYPILNLYGDFNIFSSSLKEHVETMKSVSKCKSSLEQPRFIFI